MRRERKPTMWTFTLSFLPCFAYLTLLLTSGEGLRRTLIPDRFITSSGTYLHCNGRLLEPTEYFIVKPDGLNIQVLVNNEQPVIAAENSPTTMTTEITLVKPPSSSGWKVFFEKIALSLETLWRNMLQSSDTVGMSNGESRPTTRIESLSPMIFIHGSFHAAWCFAEHYFAFFSDRLCYAVSLRGTSATGMPPGETSSKVDIDTHTDDVGFVCEKIASTTQSRRKPIVIAHSFGGIVLMKLLESTSFRDSIGGAIFMCSVPPSGNGPMTIRFCLRNVFQALKIVWGFVFKAATTNADLSRELFFDDELDNEVLYRYMKRFQEDSRVGIDLQALGSKLPSKTANVKGEAGWIENSKRLPILVLGAGSDYIVDREGVRETATFLGTKPVYIEGAPHDLMLASRWRDSSEIISTWMRENKL